MLLKLEDHSESFESGPGERNNNKEMINHKMSERKTVAKDTSNNFGRPNLGRNVKCLEL